MSSNLLDFIKSNLSLNSINSPAIIQGNSSYNYHDISRHVVSISSLFLSNVSSEFVVVDGDLSYDTLCIILACFLRGLSFTIFVGLSEEEKSLRMQILQSHHQEFIKLTPSLVTSSTQSFGEIVQTSFVDFNASHTYSSLFLFSSGSTGTPKLISVNTNSFLSLYSFSSISIRNKSRRYILSLLIDHIGGLNTFLSSFSSFSTLVLPESSSLTSLIDAMELHSVSILPSTPSILNILSQDVRFNSDHLTELRLITYGTENMPEHLLFHLRSLFSRVKFLQTFGTSETGILPTLPSGSSGKIRFRSNSDFKIENSRLYVRKLYSSSYDKLTISDPLSHSDQWFATGDLAVLNSDSTITILGRDKDVINVGGLKVSPSEIEDIAFSHPQVFDCVSYPLPNPFTGQAVALRIVVNRSCSDHASVISDLKDIYKLSDKRKRPVIYKLVDFIEISSRGKKVRTFTN